MVVYKCDKCDKLFKKKNDYERHKTKKKPCKIYSFTLKHFECSKCNKKFTSKYNLERHLLNSCDSKKTDFDKEQTLEFNSNRNKHIDECDQKLDKHIDFMHSELFSIKNPSNLMNIHQNPSKNKEYKCIYCDKFFSRKDALNIHIDKRCKIKKEQEKEKEDIYKKLIEQMEQIKKQNEIIIKENIILKKQIINNKTINSNNTQMVNSNNNNTQNIQNNIKLVAFGEEDLSYLSEQICKFFLKKGYQSVPQLVEHVHFNKNNPENHNVYIPNMKDLYAMIFDGKQWNLKEKEEIVNQLFDDKELFLQDKYKEYFDNLDEITKKKFKRFLEQTDSETKKKLKHEIKLLIYNKKNIPIKTKKSINQKKTKLLN